MRVGFSRLFRARLALPFFVGGPGASADRAHVYSFKLIHRTARHCLWVELQEGCAPGHNGHRAESSCHWSTATRKRLRANNRPRSRQQKRAEIGRAFAGRGNGFPDSKGVFIVGDGKHPCAVALAAAAAFVAGTPTEISKAIESLVSYFASQTHVFLWGPRGVT